MVSKNKKILKQSKYNYYSLLVLLLHSYFLFLFFLSSVPMLTYAESSKANLKLLFFKKIDKENIFFSTPFMVGNDIAVVSQQKKIIIFPRERYWKEIEIEIQSSAISEMQKIDESSYLFCSDDGNIVKIGKFIEPKKFQLPFPCISPPTQVKQKIVSVDILGNTCIYTEKNSHRRTGDAKDKKEGESEIKEKKTKSEENDLRGQSNKEGRGGGEEEVNLECIELTEEKKLYEPKILFPFTPKILTIGKIILIPYENKIFAISDDLKIKYPLAEIQNSKFISFLGYKNDNLVVVTENKVLNFAVLILGDIIRLRRKSEILIKDVYGADFDGEKAIITSGEGIIIFDIEKMKILKKKIRGVIEYSPPLIFGDKILFAARFGEKLGNIFGPRKISIIIAEYKREKPKIYFTKEIIVDSFPQRLVLDKNKLLFISENGTLYAFSFTK